MTSALMPTYARIDLAFTKGAGAWVEATNGRRYLDFGSGIAVSALGHAHPHLVNTLIERASDVWHTSNLYKIPEAERLAERLVAATFADTVFFTNSGAEAMECAIKMARKYQSAKGHPEKYRIITFEGAFHGRTLATVSAGGNPKYLEGFGPKVDGFDQVPFADHEALKAAITPQTGAILVEPVMGEGGIRVVPKHCLQGLRALCDAHGLLLIFDEVQSGMGRTGTLFAYEQAGITPDIMASAKGIGGGFPLGACLATAEAAQGMTYGSHGTTYGGNPLGTAIGNAVMDVMMADGFLTSVQATAKTLRQALADLQARHPSVIAQVRGQGLLLGLKLSVPNGEFAAAAREQGLLIVPAGDNVVRLLPPLIIGDAEIREAITRLGAACASFAAEERAQ